MIDRLLAPFAPQMLSVLRIAVALTFVSHGTVKLWGFPTPPTARTAPALFSLFWFSGAIELIGGTLLLVGLLTRPVAFLCSGFAAFAYFISTAPRGVFIPMWNGGEAAYLFCFIFLYLAVAGGGPWSLDARMGSNASRR